MRSVAVVFALVAVLAVSVAAQSSTGGAGPANPPNVCDRLTAAVGSNWQVATAESTALTALLTKAATNANGANNQGFFTDVLTKSLFDGSMNYRQNGPVPQPWASAGAAPNYIGNAGQLATLLSKFSTFLGQAGALGCSATGFPTYSSTASGFGAFTQYQIHANMNITGSAFSAFNNYVVLAASTMGASTADQATILAVLGSFGRNNAATGNANSICWDPASCPCATGLVGANCDAASAATGVQVSFVTMAFAAILAVFAMRR